MTRLLRRLRRRRAQAADEARPPAPRGLGEPSAPEAGDAELDALRAELVRELDRMAAGAGQSSAFRRC